MTFEDDYNEFMYSGGLHEESIEKDYEQIDHNSNNNTMKINGCSNKEFLSFMIGGLSCSDIPDERKSSILHMIAENIGVTHEEASRLLQTLNTNAGKYSDNAGGENTPFKSRDRDE
jgi:hypothetical protein